MANAKKIKYDSTEVVVDYAIKDSKGNQIDTTYQKNLPTTTTAGKVLKSTGTAGVVEWGEGGGGGSIIYVEEFNIFTTLTNISAASSNPSQIESGETKTLTFTANSGYTLPTTVAVSGATYSWNQSTGALTVSNPIDTVVIAISGVPTTGGYKLTISEVYDSGYGYDNTDGTKIVANGQAVSVNAWGEITGGPLPKEISGVTNAEVQVFADTDWADVKVVSGKFKYYDSEEEEWYTVKAGEEMRFDVSTDIVLLEDTVIQLGYCLFEEPVETYNMSWNLTNCTSNETPSTISRDDDLYFTITPNEGYVLPESITITNADYNYPCEEEEGNLNIWSPTDDVTITIVATPQPTGPYTITYDLTNCTGSSSNPTTIEAGAQDVSASFTANSGYTLFERDECYSAYGAECWFDSVDSSLYLSNPTENVVVAMTALPEETYDVTTTLTHVSVSPSIPSTMTSNEELYITITPETGYIVTEDDISVDNAVYSFDDGDLWIGAADGDVTITITAQQVIPHKLKISGTVDKNALVEGESYTSSITVGGTTVSVDRTGTVVGTIPQEFSNVTTAVVDQVAGGSDFADIDVISGSFYYYDEEGDKVTVTTNMKTDFTPTTIYLTADTEIKLGFANV